MTSRKGSGDTKCHGEASVEIIAVLNLFEQNIAFDLSLLCPAGCKCGAVTWRHNGAGRATVISAWKSC